MLGNRDSQFASWWDLRDDQMSAYRNIEPKLRAFSCKRGKWLPVGSFWGVVNYGATPESGLMTLLVGVPKPHHRLRALIVTLSMRSVIPIHVVIDQMTTVMTVPDPTPLLPTQALSQPPLEMGSAIHNRATGTMSFALNEGNRWFGVSCGHVLNNIGGPVYRPPLQLTTQPIGVSKSVEVFASQGNIRWLVDVGLFEITDPTTAQGYQGVRRILTGVIPFTINESMGPFEGVHKPLGFTSDRVGVAGHDRGEHLKIMRVDFHWRYETFTASVLVGQGLTVSYGDSGAPVFDWLNGDVIGIIQGGTTDGTGLVAIIPIDQVCASVRRQVNAILQAPVQAAP